MITSPVGLYAPHEINIDATTWPTGLSHATADKSKAPQNEQTPATLVRKFGVFLPT